MSSHALTGFDVCPFCGQHHPRGMTSHRTLEGEWCAPTETMSDADLERVRSQNATSFNISWRDARWAISTAIAERARVTEMRATLALYVVFRGADDDGGESDECALCEARWPVEGDAKHDDGCVLA